MNKEELMSEVLCLYQTSLYWMLADSEEVARDFLATVCKWNMETGLPTHNRGRWRR